MGFFVLIGVSGGKSVYLVCIIFIREICMIPYLFPTSLTKQLKRLFLTALCVFSIFQGSGFVAGSYEDFSKDLTRLGIDTAKIEKQESLSRYDLARLLNAVECNDCIVVPQWMQEQYSYQFWNDFVWFPGKDFADISHLWARYTDQSYYYCVAYVGDQNYMRWYPQEVSPICGGKFCGTRNTTYGEFYQVIVNLLGKYIFQEYSANRSDIHTWMNTLQKGSYPDQYLNADDRSIISQNAKNNQAEKLQKDTDFPVYLKYCMFNLEACGFQEFGKIKQAYWPVAEFNVLYQKNIFDQQVLQDAYIYGLVDGKTVLETLFKLYEVVQCEFDFDYDNDMWTNAASYSKTADNCSYACNPLQKDTDGDGKGDACDDDIDGDGVKNPIGIVDDRGNIDISKYVPWMDNCPLIPNTAQLDSNRNGVGDACEDASDQLGIYLIAEPFAGLAPLTLTLEAITKGVVDRVERNFGDGTSAKGNKVTHTFVAPGTYTIIAKAIGVASGVQAQAKTTLLVGGQAQDFFWLQIKAPLLHTQVGASLNFSALIQGKIDRIVRTVGDISEEKTPQTVFSPSFQKTGMYIINAKGFSQWTMVAAASALVSAGQESATLLSATPSVVKKGSPVLLQTSLKGISSADIRSVERKFGDGKMQITTTPLINYTYTSGGKKIVVQNITLKDGSILSNFLTIFVQDDDLSSSYAVFAIPQYLLSSRNSAIGFSIMTMGTNIPAPLLVSYDRGDNTSEKIASPVSFPKRFAHSYNKSASYMPTFRWFINACISVESQATLVVASNDICLDARIKWTLSTFSCDMDNDGIPDICDTDIDGDGRPNLLGLILFEQEDCRIDRTNINPETLALHQQGLCTLDNCPFLSNSDQRDINLNMIGDVCEDIAWYLDLSLVPKGIISDRDGDGIPDDLDLCPDIPEEYNGIEDLDGCPELWIREQCDPRLIFPGLTVDGKTIVDCENMVDCSPAPITTVNCNSCPCHFSDFSSDLHREDKVRAVLLTTDLSSVYTFSIPAPVSLFISK
jgi:hypothetical protein